MCNHNPPYIEKGGLEVQGHPDLHSNSQVGMEYLTPCLKIKTSVSIKIAKRINIVMKKITTLHKKKIYFTFTKALLKIDSKNAFEYLTLEI